MKDQSKLHKYENSSSLRASTSTVSLLMLNDDCLKTILNFLSLEDCMKLADTCCHLRDTADMIYADKFTKFTFDENLMELGFLYVDRIFSHLSKHLLALEVKNLSGISVDYILIKIKEHIELNYLDGLHLTGLNTDVHEKISSLQCLAHLKSLTVDNCCFNDFLCNVLVSVRHLKCLKINYCDNVTTSLGICLKNNKNITSFTFSEWNLNDFEWLQLLYSLNSLQNLERLSLFFSIHRFKIMSSLQFSRLSKLTLSCLVETAINILSNLAAKEVLKELELIDVKVDKSIFDTLKSFPELQKLIVNTSHAFEFEPSYAVPRSLKIFQIGGCTIYLKTMLFIIKRFRDLKNVDFSYCKIVDYNGHPIKKLDVIKRIDKALDFDGNEKILNVFLSFPDDIDQSKKNIDAGRLQFKRFDKMSNVFDITDPGHSCYLN